MRLEGVGSGLAPVHTHPGPQGLVRLMRRQAGTNSRRTSWHALVIPQPLRGRLAGS